jgi:benzoate 4-monooxygenase
MKDPMVYAGFSVLGNDNILSATDRFVHARLRRLLAHSFSLRGLAPSESTITEKVQQYVACAVKGSQGGAVDILGRTHELFLDIVSQLSYGKSFDCLGDESATARGDVAVYFSIVPLLAFLPFLRNVPLPAIQSRLKGLNRLIEFSSVHVDAYLEKMSSKPDGVVSSGSFLDNLATAVDPETGTKLTRDDLIEHSILFLAAGSGTTSVTLTYLLWECGRSNLHRNRLTEEIRAAFPDPSVMPDYEKASQLVSYETSFMHCFC